MEGRSQEPGTRGWKLVILLVMMVVGPAASARDQELDSDREHLRMTLRMYNDAALSPTEVNGAAKQAAAIFKLAGIDTLWLGDSRSSEEALNDPALRTNVEPTDFAVRIVATALPYALGSPEDTLGLTMPCRPEKVYCITTVFYLCANELAVSARRRVAEVLGYAIAHEVGHVLLGTMSHSPYGIMRAKWTAKDFAWECAGCLRFTVPEARRIAAAVRERMENHDRLLRARAVQ
jgi:hypothetical protein